MSLLLNRLYALLLVRGWTLIPESSSEGQRIYFLGHDGSVREAILFSFILHLGALIGFSEPVDFSGHLVLDLPGRRYRNQRFDTTHWLINLLLRRFPSVDGHSILLMMNLVASRLGFLKVWAFLSHRARKTKEQFKEQCSTHGTYRKPIPIGGNQKTMVKPSQNHGTYEKKWMYPIPSTYLMNIT